MRPFGVGPGPCPTVDGPVVNIPGEATPPLYKTATETVVRAPTVDEKVRALGAARPAAGVAPGVARPLFRPNAHTRPTPRPVPTVPTRAASLGPDIEADVVGLATESGPTRLPRVCHHETVLRPAKMGVARDVAVPSTETADGRVRPVGVETVAALRRPKVMAGRLETVAGTVTARKRPVLGLSPVVVTVAVGPPTPVPVPGRRQGVRASAPRHALATITMRLVRPAH